MFIAAGIGCGNIKHLKLDREFEIKWWACSEPTLCQPKGCSTISVAFGRRDLLI